MAIHQMTIREGDSPSLDILAEIAAAPEIVTDDMPEITDEEIAEIQAASKRPSFFDTPGQPLEQLQQFERVRPAAM